MRGQSTAAKAALAAPAEERSVRERYQEYPDRRISDKLNRYG